MEIILYYRIYIIAILKAQVFFVRNHRKKFWLPWLHLSVKFEIYDNKFYDLCTYKFEFKYVFASVSSGKINEMCRNVTPRYKNVITKLPQLARALFTQSFSYQVTSLPDENFKRDEKFCHYNV